MGQLKRLRALCTAMTLIIGLGATMAGAFDYDEAIGGDLPGLSPPPLFPFDLGSNTVSGTILGSGDLDSIRFIIPPGAELATVNLEIAAGHLLNTRYTIRTADNSTELLPEETVSSFPFNGALFSAGLPLAEGAYKLHHAGFSSYSTPDADYVFTFGVALAQQEIQIDIKPGSDPNCFNVNGHGVIPVAILGSADFEVAQIDPFSLAFDGLAVRVRGKRGPLCSEEDSNGDGVMDLVCHFEDDAEYWVGGGDTGTVTGILYDGSEFVGTDSICIVPE